MSGFLNGKKIKWLPNGLKTGHNYVRVLNVSGIWAVQGSDLHVLVTVGI
jgi:hypothetical protein